MRARLAVTHAGLVLSLSGCPNPSLYTTPRTLDPGKVQFQLAPEVIGVNYNAAYGSTDASGNPIKTNVSGALPMPPTFGVRIGLVQGLEIGLRVPNLEPAAADAKIRVLRGRVDIALDPGFQFHYASVNGSSFSAGYLHAPLLLGINFSEKVSLVLSPGLVYAGHTAIAAAPSGVAGSSAAEGFMARLGVGFDFRVGPKLSIHPEVTLMRQFTGREDLLLGVGGVGFNFGARPDYSDLARAPNGAAPPSSPVVPAIPAEPAPPSGTPTEL